MYKKLTIIICIVLIIFSIIYYFKFLNNKTIYIAYSLPDKTSLITKEQIRGMEMALQVENYKSGNFNVQLFPMDDSDEYGWSVDLEEKNAKDVVLNDKVVAYYGPYNSGAAKISIPILNEAGILQISPATWPGLTKNGYSVGSLKSLYPTGVRTFYRIAPNDYSQAKTGVDFMIKNKIQNIIIIHDNSLYGKEFALIFKNIAESSDIRVNEIYMLGEVDIINKIVNKDPQAVLFCGGATRTDLSIYSNLRKYKYGGIIIGSAFFNTGIESIVSSDDRNLYTISSGIPIEYIDNSLAKVFYTSYIEKYKEEPSPFALFANQSIRIILKAIEISDGTREGIASSMESIKGIDTAYGPFSFDESGDILKTKPAVLHMVSGIWRNE